MQEYNEEEEKGDMCQAIEDMKMEARKEGERIGMKLGMKRGIKRSMKRGIKRGMKRGIKRGMLKHAQMTARNLYEMGMEVKLIAKGVGYRKRKVKRWLGL